MQNENETKTINTYCDCCDETARGTKDSLRARGWGFANGSEFCPECND